MDITQIILNRMAHNASKNKAIKSTSLRCGLLKQRLLNYSKDDLLLYVDYIWHSWASWELRDKYYQPESIFRKSNFEKHFQNCTKSQKQLNNNYDLIDNKSFEDYKHCILRPSSYFGYIYRHYFEDDQRIKIDTVIKNGFESGQPENKVLSVAFVEYLKKQCKPKDVKEKTNILPVIKSMPDKTFNWNKLAKHFNGIKNG